MEKTKSSCEKVSNHIPADLTVSILSKLFLKSLVRFRCVRKSWSLLFQDSYFMNMYRIHFASNHNYMYADDSCITLEGLQPYQHGHQVLFSHSGERFKNKVKLDLPPPFQENDTCFEFLGSVVDGTICFYQGLKVGVCYFMKILGSAVVCTGWVLIASSRGVVPSLCRLSLVVYVYGQKCLIFLFLSSMLVQWCV
ncbi:putative F-box protein At1g47730 [Lathyrus oleraceus]|uniref:putative F-box protein At1g47730 n=1 Tax=Pisum sativum TaxID=3888 RepID=UPI0021D12789|nr:putative F-box protein At1g47730 [Pisum sativum]